MEKILTIWYRKAEVSYSYSWITYTPHKFGKLSEEWWPPLSMKWKSLNMCFPEHKETTGREGGRKYGRTEGRKEGWMTVPSETVADRKEWEFQLHISQNFWMGIFSCGRHTAVDSHHLAKEDHNPHHRKLFWEWFQNILLPTLFYEKTHLLRLELGRLKILLFFESTTQILFALLEAFSGNKRHRCKTLFLHSSIAMVSKHLSEWH